MVAVVLGHVLLGVVIWTVLPLFKLARFTPPFEAPFKDAHHWFSPGDFRRIQAPITSLPVKSEPPLAALPSNAPIKRAAELKDVPSTLAETPLVSPQRSMATAARPTSKIITLSPVLELDPNAQPQVRSSRPPITMMEVLKQAKLEEAERQATGGANMDRVLKALEQALSQSWNPPPVNEVPVLQRDARLQFIVGRDGTVLQAEMTKKSGATALDESVTQAAKALKKISESLPSSFPKDRYTVEVNFHIE